MLKLFWILKYFLRSVLLCFCDLSGICYIVQAGLKLKEIFLPLPLKSIMPGP